MNKIRLGVPKGSLNTVGRGNTHQLFVDAGYDIKGYEPKKESDKRLRIANDPEVELALVRPQSAPVELSRELLDIAVVGKDWIEEESVNMTDTELKLIGDLNYGKTRLVICIKNEEPYQNLTEFFEAQRGRKTPILCFTEYPNVTRKRFMQDPVYQELFGSSKPLIQVRGLVDGDNKMVQIINSDGVTEGYMAKGADLIVDNTQTGSTIKLYGLREIETIMESSAGLYAGPGCTGWKEEKAKEIFKFLNGAVVGKQYFDVKFNVGNGNLEAVKQYLVSEKLCSNEPTVSKGEKFSAVNILMPRDQFPGTLMILRQKFKASAVVRNDVKQFID
jgi:ATP phosphoribosyltransferase